MSGFSDPTNKQWFADRLEEIKPQTALDAGPGRGIYGTIIASITPECRVTGVEVWEPYVKQYNLANIYDELVIHDIREHDDFDFDLVIFGDIMEHMTAEEAITLWERSAQQARWGYLSIPIIHHPQEPLDGNPYEEHIDEDWSHERVMDSFAGIQKHALFQVTGTYLAKF
jgi:hypothetical protein